MTRRLLPFTPALVAACLLYSAGVRAQTFPDKPIRLIVPAPSGTVTDLSARRLSEKAAQTLGQPIVVENRAGASGAIGAQAVARAKPDGYTLYFGSNQTHATNMVLLKNPGYDSLKDFAPIARLVVNAQVFAVNAGVGAKTVRELVELARAKPNTLSFASAGKGTTAHLAGEMLKNAAAIEITHVPYNSPQLLTDLVAGHTSMIVYPYFALKPLIDGGKLRVLATMGASRAAWMPAAPTMIESGYPGFTWASWFAVYGPAGLSRDIADRVSAAYAGVLKDPAVTASLLAGGSEPFYAGPAELADFTRVEIERVRQVVQAAKLTIED